MNNGQFLKHKIFQNLNLHNDDSWHFKSDMRNNCINDRHYDDWWDCSGEKAEIDFAEKTVGLGIINIVIFIIAFSFVRMSAHFVIHKWNRKRVELFIFLPGYSVWS